MEARSELSIDVGHNDLYERPAYVAAMRETLARVESAVAVVKCFLPSH